MLSSRLNEFCVKVEKLKEKKNAVEIEEKEREVRISTGGKWFIYNIFRDGLD